MSSEMRIRTMRITLTGWALIAYTAPLLPLHQKDDMRIVVYQGIVVAVYGMLFLLVGRSGRNHRTLN